MMRKIEMKGFMTQLGYTLRTYRLDMFVLPVALWTIFAIVVLIKNDSGIDQVAGGFFGFGLPLISGILASNAILDISIHELKFTLPKTKLGYLVERQLVIFIIIALAAVSFQIYLDLAKVDLSFMGSLVNRQIAWILPTATLMGLGCACTLLSAQTMNGAMAVGLIWIMEVIAHEWFMQSSLRSLFFIFLRAYAPEHQNLLPNNLVQLSLFGGSYFLAWFLLKRPERFV